MGEAHNLYRMNRLMNYTELDAFTAQKNAGSKSAYFALLDEFGTAGPALVAGLTVPANAKELDAFQKNVYELQKLLLAIGCSSLLWEAESLAEFARTGEDSRRPQSPALKGTEKDEVLAKRIKFLASKVQSLGTKLAEAIVDPASTSASTRISADTWVIAMKQAVDERPKAATRPEAFEKLCALVENYETDDALRLLADLMQSSFSKEVNGILVQLHSDLVHFDYDSAAAQTERLMAAAKEGETDGAPKDAKKKILAIDDVPDVLNTVKSVLGERYAVYCVTNHMAALKFLTNNRADLILLDIEMPDMDGFTLLGIIRQIKAYEKTPTVYLTGSVTVESIVKARNAGGNDFIKKPIDAQVLLAKIGKLLE